MFPNSSPWLYSTTNNECINSKLGKGPDPFARSILGINNCIKEKSLDNKVVYRGFKRNWLQFWSWGEFLFHPRCRLPYKPIILQPSDPYYDLNLLREKKFNKPGWEKWFL